MKTCITHHHACDCREEKFRQLEKENERLKAERDALRTSRDWWIKKAKGYYARLEKAGLTRPVEVQPVQPEEQGK